MATETHTTDCLICRASNTRKVSAYDVFICPACWDNIAAGWPIHLEPILRAGLTRQGCFLPDRTDAGLLPREWRAPDFPI